MIIAHLRNTLRYDTTATICRPNHQVQQAPCFGFSSVQFSGAVMSDSFNPMDCSMPGFAVHHQFTELAQTHVHRIGDAIQPFILCHPPLLLPSIFPSIKVFSNESVLWIRWPKYWSFSFPASVLPMNIQDWFPLGWTDWIFLQSKGLLRVFSNTTVQKHQFFDPQLSLYSNSHIHTRLLEKP